MSRFCKNLTCPKELNIEILSENNSPFQIYSPNMNISIFHTKWDGKQVKIRFYMTRSDLVWYQSIFRHKIL